MIVSRVGRVNARLLITVNHSQHTQRTRIRLRVYNRTNIILNKLITDIFGSRIIRYVFLRQRIFPTNI